MLLFLLSHLLVLLRSLDVEDVVTSDQHLPEVPSLGPVNELLCVGQLEVHVAVGGHQKSFENLDSRQTLRSGKLYPLCIRDPTSASPSRTSR